MAKTRGQTKQKSTPLNRRLHKNRNKDFIEVGDKFVCIKDDGRGDGVCRLGPKERTKIALNTHVFRKHNITIEKKAKFQKNNIKSSVAARAKTSLTSNATLSKLTNRPLLKIEPYSDNVDKKNSPAHQEFGPIDNAKLLASKEKFSHYHATLYVAYFVPGKIDLGPEKIYKLKKRDKKFIFYFYFGSSVKKHCEYLEGTAALEKCSELVKLMNDGAVCYTKDYVYDEGTTAENQRRAMTWQHLWKTVNVKLERVEKDGNAVTVKILNVGLEAKIANLGLRTDESEFATNFASQRRSFFPLPKVLLPEDQDPPFVPFLLKKKKGKKAGN